MRWLVLDYKKKKDRENNMMEDQDIERVSKGDPRVSVPKDDDRGLCCLLLSVVLNALLIHNFELMSRIFQPLSCT